MANKPFLQEKYRSEVVPALMKEFGYKSVMQVPRIEKIVLNMGLGEAKEDEKILETGVYTLREITGQQPAITRAKKAISNFKLRENLAIGCMVTLRGNRMYEFLHRLLAIALPRVRDFKGVSPKSFDSKGNYTIGLKEQLIFPEVNFDKISKIKGMNITIVTTAKNNEEGKAMLKLIGMPFRN